MRKLNNKGFTLVEIVIVIVIIAILAAMLVPALTQWIDKSKLKTFTSACDTIRTAVWSAAADQYAKDGTTTINNWTTVSCDVGKVVQSGNGATDNDNTFNVTYNYNAGTMTVYNHTFHGSYDGNSWDCAKNTNS